MATNEEILAAYAQRDELEEEARALRATITDAQAKLAELNERLGPARLVHAVVEGIAVVFETDRYDVLDMRTLATGPGIQTRNVHAYRVVNEDHWYVKVNEGTGLCKRFANGMVVGFQNRLTREQAKQVGLRWLKGDESVLRDLVSL